MDPVVEDEASEAEEEEERHWVTGIGWKPGPAPAKKKKTPAKKKKSPAKKKKTPPKGKGKSRKR